VSIITTIVLALAANTSFGGLPVLNSLLARDNYMPHFLGIRGDRLVYANGIWKLAGLSAALLIAVRGNTNTLIPLFAIGVFTGFTLSQTGLVVHWRRRQPRGWWRRAAINATGAVATAVATVIFTQPEEREQVLVVVPVSGINQVVAETLHHARSLSPDVVAVNVRFEDDERPPLERAWKESGPGVELVTLVSRYHSVERPLTSYVDGALATGHTLVIVLIPFIAPRRPLHWALQNQLDVALTVALRRRRNVIVARTPYQLRD
jgi:amino acid transporter